MKQLIVLLALLWAAMVPGNPAVANDLPSPTSVQTSLHVVSALAEKFRRPPAEIAKILDLAVLAAEDVRRTGSKFPKLKDILAIIWIESSFNPEASHWAGPSLGLMQVNAKVHGQIWDMDANVTKGSALLSEYSAKAPNQTLALIYYNAGPAGAKRICGKALACKTPYTKKFVKARKELDAIFAQT